MATKGKSITNNITSEKITWIETSADTNGKHLLLEIEVGPKGYVPVKHIHPSQDESFEILSGSLRLEVNEETTHLEELDKLTVSKGDPHQWWNDSQDTTLKMRLKFEPAMKTEIFFEQFFGLANDGKTKADGSPKFLQVMAMCNAYDIYIAGPPILAQKIMSWTLGGVARLMGYKKFYKKYSE